MKITEEHYQELARAFEVGKARVPPLDEYEGSGLSAKRWRWDALWESKVLREGDLCQRLYAYLNDVHIDTALKRISGTR